MVNWITGKVTNIKFWTDRLFSLNVYASINSFKAGQFTKLLLEINGERVQRAYSYVNAPDNPNLEFYIVKILNGKLSSKLATLKIGDSIQITSEAAGFFVLKEVPDCDTLWMFATGTAIGPYLSILQYGRDLERFNNIVLIQAVRYVADLSYLSLFQELQKKYAEKLHIQTIVSREKTIGSLTGRIPTLIKDGTIEHTIGLPINNKTSHVMLCGNPHMVHDTQQVLIEIKKMTKNLRHCPGNITTEHYW